MQRIEVIGRRVRLRDWTLEDLPAWAYWQQPHHEWYKYDGPWWGVPRSETLDGKNEEHRAKILAGDWPTPRTRLVIGDLGSDQFLGTVNRYWECKETNWLAIGIGIYDPQNWGKGLGFEALGLWTDHVFKALPDLVRLGLGTWSGNVGMVRLAQKLGYLQEACFRKARIVRGEYYDAVGFGILREEWTERYPNGFAVDALGVEPPKWILRTGEGPE
jgi:RimJ/RimL family protein N-acetyltransferase